MADETVTFHAEPWRAAALREQTLRFAPPYAELASDPDGFAYWWKMLAYVYDPPNPHTFPPLANIDPQERTILRRYADSCEELAQATILSHGGGISVEFSDGKEKLTADEPPRESIRGGVLLFRQIASDNETASYSTVRKIIGRRIHEQRDAEYDRRDEMQRSWNRTRAGVLGGLLTAAADRKAAQAQGAHEDFPVAQEHVKPMELISLFEYGDLVHWDRRRDEMSLLQDDHFKYKMTTFNFLESVIQMSHVYVGYSILVKRALDLPTYSGA